MSVKNRLSLSKELALRSPEDIVRQREAEKAAAPQIAYERAITVAMMRINQAAKEAVEFLNQVNWPGGVNHTVVTGYTPKRRFLPRLNRNWPIWLGRYYEPITEERATLWRRVYTYAETYGDCNVCNTSVVFVASNGKVYVESDAAQKKADGSHWSGLHVIDSSDLADPASVWRCYTYGDGDSRSEGVAHVANGIVKALKRVRADIELQAKLDADYQNKRRAKTARVV